MIALVTVRRAGCKRSNRALPWGICFVLELILMTSPFVLQAQNVRVDATATRNAIQIADPFELEIRVVAPHGTQVSLPPTTETLGPFEVLDCKDKIDLPVSIKNTDDRFWIRSMSLETLKTGRLEIPAIEIGIKQAGQPEEIFRTELIPINVGSVVEATAELTNFKDIASVRDVETPAPRANRWGWLGGLGISAVAMAIGLVVGARFLINRSNPIISAKTWALKKLDAADELDEAEAILRQFIEERFDCAATSLPATEIFAVLRSREVQESVGQGVQEFLEISERAKFGGLNLPATEKSRLVNLATQLVETLDQTGGRD